MGLGYRVLNVTSLHTERLHVTCNRRVSWQMVCVHVSGLRGSWGTEYFSTLSGVCLTQERPWWRSSGPLVIEDGAHECNSGGWTTCGGNTRPVRGVQAPAPAWAINRSGFRIWAINGTGWGKATLFATTPVAGHQCGGSTIQQYESLAVQQVLRA